MSAPTSQLSPRVFGIDGLKVNSIGELYVQLNESLRQNDQWKMAASLDALNDVLYQLVAQSPAPIIIHWNHHEHSRQALGLDTTVGWLDEKLAQPERFNPQVITEQKRALLAGEGKTYFDLVLEVFSIHPSITLSLQ